MEPRGASFGHSSPFEKSVDPAVRLSRWRPDRKCDSAKSRPLSPLGRQERSSWLDRKVGGQRSRLCGTQSTIARPGA